MKCRINYYQLLLSLGEESYKAFTTFSLNEEFVANAIFSRIQCTIAGCADIFRNTRSQFVHWLTDRNPDGSDFSYFDSTLIEYLSRSNDVWSFYNGDLGNIDTLLSYLLTLWETKTRSLKQNMSKLHMIYLRYVRFLNSESGYDYLYGKSLDLIPMLEIPFSEDRPFYEDYNYKIRRLGELKKKVILMSCGNPLEVCSMSALWDVTFSENVSFNYKAVERLVWERLGEDSVSHTKLFSLLKKLNVRMLKYILKGNLLEEYFDNVTFELNGKIKTLRSSLEEHLVKILAEDNKKLRYTNVGIVNAVERLCRQYGLVCSSDNSYSNVLVKVKADDNFLSKKSWKLYFFKGGGWYCFSTGHQGYITDLVPKDYLV